MRSGSKLTANGSSLLLLLRCLLFTGNCFTLTFSCTAICSCTLTTNWQSFTVTQTTVASDIKQTLNTHLYFTAQRTFHFQLFSYSVTNCIQFFIIPIVHFLVTINIILIQNKFCSRGTNTIDIGKSYLSSFIFW